MSTTTTPADGGAADPGAVYRPRCGSRELEPAASANDSEPCLRGFWPCPDPHAAVRYPLEERRGG